MALENLGNNKRASHINTFGFFAFAGLLLATTAFFSVLFPERPLYTLSILPEGFTVRNFTLIIFYCGLYLLIYKSYEPIVSNKFLRMILGFGVVLVSLFVMVLGYSYYIQGIPIRAVIFFGLSTYLVAAVFEDLMTRRRRVPNYLAARADLQLFLAKKRSFLLYFVYVAGIALSISLFLSGLWIFYLAAVIMLAFCIAGLAASSGVFPKLAPYAEILSFSTLGVAFVYSIIFAVTQSEFLYLSAVVIIGIIFGVKFLTKQERKGKFAKLNPELVSVLKFKFETEKVVWLTISVLYFFAMKQTAPLHDPMLCTLTSLLAAFFAFFAYHLLPVRFSSRIEVLFEIEAFQVVVLLAALSSGGLASPFSFLIYLPVLTAIWGVPLRWAFAPISTAFFTVLMLWWSDKFTAGVFPVDPFSNPSDRIAAAHLLGTVLLGVMAGLLLRNRDRREKRLESMHSELTRKESAVEEAKNRVEKEKARFIRILGNIGYGVASISIDGRINSLNDVGAKLIGLSDKEAEGLDYTKVFHFIDGEGGLLDPVAEALEGSQAKLGDDALLVKERDEKGEKKVVAVDVTASPLKKERVESAVEADLKDLLGVLLVFRDVSEEREASRIKSDFVSITSHQLRTPLSSLRWNLEMLSKGEAGKLSKEQKKMVEDAFESAKRMAGLINDLLNVTGLDSGKTKLSPKPTDLVKLAKKVLKHYEPEIKKSGVELSLEEPASNFGKIKIDPNLIEQALDNLVSNAVKYTPKGGKITLKIEKKEDEALITVKDTGIGIPASIQRDIFKKFYRSKRAISVHPEGTGLGLFIAKNAVEMSGGRIWFESEEGAGTTFYVALPLEPPSRGKTKEK